MLHENPQASILLEVDLWELLLLLPYDVLLLRKSTTLWTRADMGGNSRRSKSTLWSRADMRTQLTKKQVYLWSRAEMWRQITKKQIYLVISSWDVEATHEEASLPYDHEMRCGGNSRRRSLPYDHEMRCGCNSRRSKSTLWSRAEMRRQLTKNTRQLSRQLYIVISPRATCILTTDRGGRCAFHRYENFSQHAHFLSYLVCEVHVLHNLHNGWL